MADWKVLAASLGEAHALIAKRDAEIERLRATAVQWKPIAELKPDPNGHHIVALICGGTYYSTMETYPGNYPLDRAREAYWTGSEWRSQDEAHDEFYIYSPTHFAEMPAPFAAPAPAGAAS